VVSDKWIDAYAITNDDSSTTVSIDETEIAWSDDRSIYERSGAPGIWLSMTNGTL
jgi:hypothetical protein